MVAPFGLPETAAVWMIKKGSLFNTSGFGCVFLADGSEKGISAFTSSCVINFSIKLNLLINPLAIVWYSGPENKNLGVPSAIIYSISWVVNLLNRKNDCS